MNASDDWRSLLCSIEFNIPPSRTAAHDPPRGRPSFFCVGRPRTFFSRGWPRTIAPPRSAVCEPSCGLSAILRCGRLSIFHRSRPPAIPAMPAHLPPQPTACDPCRNWPSIFRRGWSRTTVISAATGHVQSPPWPAVHLPPRPAG